MPPFRRLAAFSLALALASSLASAAPRDVQPPRGKTAVAAAPADTLLTRLWGRLIGAWTKAGCIIDPDGRCLGDSGTMTAPPEEGCAIDPSGGPCAGGR
jgi:hypothetical protein